MRSLGGCGPSFPEGAGEEETRHSEPRLLACPRRARGVPGGPRSQGPGRVRFEAGGEEEPARFLAATRRAAGVWGSALSQRIKRQGTAGGRSARQAPGVATHSRTLIPLRSCPPSPCSGGPPATRRSSVPGPPARQPRSGGRHAPTSGSWAPRSSAALLVGDQPPGPPLHGKLPALNPPPRRHPSSCAVCQHASWAASAWSRSSGDQGWK